MKKIIFILLLLFSIILIANKAGKEYREAPVVFVFISDQCPVSQFYVPALKTLYHQFSSQGISFYAIFPNTLSSPESIKDFARQNDLPFECIRDHKQRLSRRFQVSSTPEIIVAGKQSNVLFRGVVENIASNLTDYLASKQDTLLNRVLHAVTGEEKLDKVIFPTIDFDIALR